MGSIVLIQPVLISLYYLASTSGMKPNLSQSLLENPVNILHKHLEDTNAPRDLCLHKPITLMPVSLDEPCSLPALVTLRACGKLQVQSSALGQGEIMNFSHEMIILVQKAIKIKSAVKTCQKQQS